MSITRRLFLRHTAAAGAVGAAVVVPAIAEPTLPLTPDERIDAAIEEIKAALWQKWPDAPLHITDCDNIHKGMILIVSHVGDDKPGEAVHERTGLARIVGGAA